MVTSMLATGKTINRMARAPISTRMELLTKVNGSKISTMALARSSGSMAQCMKVSMRMVESMDEDVSPGRMVVATAENSSITVWRGKVFTFGQINVSILDNGRKIRCMVRESSPG